LENDYLKKICCETVILYKILTLLPLRQGVNPHYQTKTVHLKNLAQLLLPLVKWTKFTHRLANKANDNDALVRFDGPR